MSGRAGADLDMTAPQGVASAQAAPVVSARPERTLRPREAASILVIDRSEDRLRVLVGRRASRHVFMPDFYVFPGGRRDAADHRLAYSGDLHPAVMEKLAAGSRLPASRLRALALAAVRELYEETGLVLGMPTTAPAGVLPFLPDLRNLRYMARAVTPPGHVRRYDTRFFALYADEADIDPLKSRDSIELEDVRWIDVSDMSSVRIADITAMIVSDLRAGIEADPALPFDRAIPFYHARRGTLVRDLL